MANILNKLTSDSKARYVAHKGDPQHAGFKLVRRWERMDALRVDSLVTNLNDCIYYTNPKADAQPYTGVFIQSSLDPQVRNDDSIDIEQTLTKIKKSVSESDADIVSQIGDPKTSGYELIRAWHYIDPYSLDTLFPVVNNDSSVTNPFGNTDSIAGKFVVSRVRSEEQTDRTYDIIQDMVKVKTIDSVGDLTDPLIDRAKDIIHPFGEGTGVGRDIIYRYLNLDPESDTKCMAFADTSLVTRMSQNDSFIHVSRKTTTETNRTMTFWVLAQRKQRIAWNSTIYANPDEIESRNIGRDGSVKTKFWYGIDNDCYAAVKSKLETDADTNYSILIATVKDNDDGSDDWTQVLIKQFNDTRIDSKIINTHGVEHNGVQVKHHRFDNYTSEPATPGLAAGFKYESEKVWMDENGLISKRVITSKPYPSNRVDSNGSPDSYALVSSRNPQHTDMNGIAKQTRYSYDQIPLTRVDSVMKTLDVEADTRFIVSGIDYTDIGNGAARVDRDRKRINLTECWFVEEIGSSNNNGTKSVRRVWPYIIDSRASLLMVGAADTNFVYRNDTFLHIRNHRTKHYDGTSTVWQIGAVASATVFTGGSQQQVSDDTDSEMVYAYTTELGQSIPIIQYQKFFTNWAEARTFVDGGSDFNAPGGQTKRGHVSNVGVGKWHAIRFSKIIPV